MYVSIVLLMLIFDFGPLMARGSVGQLVAIR